MLLKRAAESWSSESCKEIHFHFGEPIFSSEVPAKERGYRQSSLTVIDQLQSSIHFVGK